MAACRKENCTVAETGTCVLNHVPSASCPNYLKDGAISGTGEATEPPLSEPQRNPRFALGQALTPQLATELMGSSYCNLIGILGIPNSGKTAVLASLYLLLARGKLDGFEFADSETLMALDEISRGARRWNDGNTPDQLTAHTELTDERDAGFLHLAIRKTATGQLYELLLPDLPGEWSTSLVDSQRTDRLEFLGRADALWILVDGNQLSKPQSRQWAIHRTKLLLQRVASFVVPCPPVFLVISRRDKGEISEPTATALNDEASLRGITLTIRPIASFADPGEVAPGFGISELVAESLRAKAEAQPIWPAVSAQHEDRNMMRFRG
jgi:hypothetical protein